MVGFERLKNARGRAGSSGELIVLLLAKHLHLTPRATCLDVSLPGHEGSETDQDESDGKGEVNELHGRRVNKDCVQHIGKEFLIQRQMDLC